MSNPRLNPVILLSPVETGYVAYDPVRDYLHQLNPVAALLTELCDGNHSLAEMRELAAPFMPEGALDEVDKWVEQGLKTGLLLPEGGEAAQARELTAAELATLTRRLRAIGNIQACYLCGRRTVELEPDNADAWYDLGEVAQCVGKREEARIAYQKYFDVHPDDGEIEHLLIALRDDAPPPRASDRAIEHIYKAFAASYETRMRQDLKYAGPERISDALTAVAGEGPFPLVLDLGCGSGLAGEMIRPRAGELTGIDLSPDMIALAEARKIYDRLEVAEITSWLNEGAAPFDLIISCDCLIYFGDLGEIVTAAVRRLKPGGYFALSMERGNRAPFHLTDTGRYTHHPDHVRDAAAKAGLRVARLDEAFLRMEWGEEVMGLYAVLAKPA
jgi:predicted TPR repeat methyltransferase